ncbi:hypothetical protein R4036_004568 [Salmonella enterica]|nr:hypothetical protein [Salmonella enterica]
MNTDELRAESTARVVATIGREMAEWQLADYALTLLPSFDPGERLRSPTGKLYTIERRDFSKCPWAGCPQFVADARKVLALKQPKRRERAFVAVCDAEREALATALMLELFAITDLDPLLARLPHLDDLLLLTVEDSDKKAIAEAFSEWIR